TAGLDRRCAVRLRARSVNTAWTCARTTARTWTGCSRTVRRGGSRSRWRTWSRASRRPGAPTRTGRASADARAGKPTVLVIEDNAALLAILEQLLSIDYAVATAGRGEEGVTRALSFRPDVVILDLQLPQMDGIEAGRWIKRELDDVPILVLTALAGQGEAEAI